MPVKLTRAMASLPLDISIIQFIASEILSLSYQNLHCMHTIPGIPLDQLFTTISNASQYWYDITTNN